MNIVETTTRKLLDSFLGILIFIASLAAFYMPYEFRIIPAVEQILPIARYICAGLLVVSFFFLYGSSLTVFRDNWALWAAAAFTGVLIFSTVMNDGDMEGALGTYGLAGLFLVMDIAVFFKVNPKKYLLIAFFLLLIVNIINTYTVYEYCFNRGTGMWEAYGQYTNWYYSLIGNYNGGIEYVLPMAICGSAYAHRYGKWLDIVNYAAMIMSLIMAVKCESMTQIIAFAATIAFMLIGNLAMFFKGFARILKIVFQPIIFIAVDFVILISVVIINKSNWVAALGIDPDFHNRRHVWNMSMEWIAANPIWGSGQETVAVEATKITGYAHSHCTYLEVAYKTGFVGSVFMLLMLVAVVVAIYRSRHNRISYMMTALLFIFGLSAVAETYPMVYVMLCLGLIYYIAKNTNETESVKERTRKFRAKTKTPEEPVQTDGGIKGQTDVEEPDTVPDNAASGNGIPGSQPTGRDLTNGGSSAHKPDVQAATKPASDVQPIPKSALDIQEEELEHIGQKVQDFQENPDLSEQNAEDDIDSTVHIDETVLMK